MSDYSVACDNCAAPTALASEIQPLGSEPGHRIFLCGSCGRHTWKPWKKAEGQQHQQQQHSNDSLKYHGLLSETEQTKTRHSMYLFWTCSACTNTFSTVRSWARL